MIVPMATGEEGDDEEVRRTRNSWNAMLNRCYQPRHYSFPNYGGRGIAVCRRWRRFRAFMRDMGTRPVGHVLDRVDNDRGYLCGSTACPECGPTGQLRNCQWTPRERSDLNCKNTVRVQLLPGLSVPLSLLADYAGVNRATARDRYRRGWELWRVLKPIGERNEK